MSSVKEGAADVWIAPRAQMPGVYQSMRHMNSNGRESPVWCEVQTHAASGCIAFVLRGQDLDVDHLDILQGFV